MVINKNNTNMNHCEKCLANFTGKHTCDPLLAGLVKKRNKKGELDDLLLMSERHNADFKLLIKDAFTRGVFHGKELAKKKSSKQ